jgi:hypothetical protein
MTSLIHRYTWRYWQPDEITCDKVWFDLKTGKIVRRYDAADPANADPNYGGIPDSEWFLDHDLDMREKIAETEAFITEDEVDEQLKDFW